MTGVQTCALPILDAAPRFEAEAELPLAEYRRLRDRDGIEAMQDAILAHPLMQLEVASPDRQTLLQRCVRTYRGADLEGGWQPVATPRLDAITAPTLVLSGGLDGLQRREAAAHLHAMIAGSQARQIAGAGHLAALDQPAQWADAVLSFVAALPGRH